MHKQNCFDVLIVGAGIAGLAAALQFSKNKKISWAILEASGRTGGRLQSVIFGGQRLDTGGYELASYGQKNTHNNQLYQLIKKGFCKIKHRQGTGKNHYYDQTGNMFSNESLVKVEKTMEKFENMSQNLIQKNKYMSVKECLDVFIAKGGTKTLNQSQLKLFNLQIQLMEQEQAGQIQDLSADFMFSEYESEQDNLDDYPLPVETYHALTQQITKDLPKQNIRFNRKVIQIQRLQNQIIIICQIVNQKQQQVKQLQKFRCHYVVCAVPLSKLKDKGINFKPILPKQYLTAIQSIGFGQMQKVFLSFEKPFWKKDTLGIKIASQRKRHIPYFTNLSKNIKEKGQTSYILCGFVTSSELLAGKNEQIIEEAVNILKKVFSSQQIKVVNAYVTNWRKEKFIEGAYSYLTPKCTVKQAMIIKKPINSYLWFAGEFVYFENFGCAHGAFATGSRAAKQILQIINQN